MFGVCAYNFPLFCTANRRQNEAVKSAAKAVGSHTEDSFDIRFNPDIFSPNLNFDQDDAEIEKQRQMIRDLARFVVKVQIPSFVSPPFLLTPSLFGVSCFVAVVYCLFSSNRSRSVLSTAWLRWMAQVWRSSCTTKVSVWDTLERSFRFWIWPARYNIFTWVRALGVKHLQGNVLAYFNKRLLVINWLGQFFCK